MSMSSKTQNKIIYMKVGQLVL